MSEEKIAAEKAKYAYREEVGFLFTGMKVFLKLLKIKFHWFRFIKVTIMWLSQGIMGGRLNQKIFIAMVSLDNAHIQ